jgi:hypothetical protein
MGLFSGAFSGGERGGKHYEVEVNREDMNAGAFERAANERYENGYRIANLFQQGGNTVCVWERYE